MSCSPKTSPGAPSELNSRLLPTTPSSDSVHNSQCLPRQMFRQPNLVPRPAVRSLVRYFLSLVSLRSRSLSFLLPRPPTPPSHPRSRCPPPAQLAPPHNSQS